MRSQEVTERESIVLATVCQRIFPKKMHDRNFLTKDPDFMMNYFFLIAMK